MHVLGDVELGLVLLAQVHAHRHRLGRGGRLVQQRGVSEARACEVPNHGLEVEEHLQTALGDLSLVGRVGRVPSGVFHEVPEDHGGGDRVVVARPDERLEDLVLVHHFLEHGEGLILAHVFRAAEFRAAANRVGNDKGDEVVNGLHLARLEHFLDLLGIRADVSLDEVVGGREESLVEMGAQEACLPSHATGLGRSPGENHGLPLHASRV
mmetsp:Transcript_16853/g.31927  ORF Transcript_16853/g.31927 Transcript_16853/m.31927 type:complete len:210 (-) Transcript_16853:16-645(-)